MPTKPYSDGLGADITNYVMSLEEQVAHLIQQNQKLAKKNKSLAKKTPSKKETE